ncbi:hypothetical protein EMIHUDRAFT_423585 [Emiliania huxleyi CCMP1516]|uniref:Asparagine synthetase domain-containing protein n=2 Tax=Emiliania huxleyi TaxID=2903 RepID=A0A0D3KDX0_EMIH1|nr:hypothetical protein EMIHUDRAFT_423585 [Emiliania huxleyi CCMP1516]EOD33955.1 hypothetical protein EMIHUDRAFT_423585 [Emiliania huxleyi CCMP1516]|eukprot:XP_005786384.1 hypothetical protein EMIHUDRAFT_423585 [Emiliania huxleyi CCMP1516]
MGGYGRHRTAFKRGGWAGLGAELAADRARLWKRNLGRDDRVVSDHGREARYPFLDEEVVATLAATPLHLLCDPRRPPGVGDKLVLRLLARSIGLSRCASLQKRAIQFGTRIANKNVSGTALLSPDIALDELVHPNAALTAAEAASPAAAAPPRGKPRESLAKPTKRRAGGRLAAKSAAAAAAVAAVAAYARLPEGAPRGPLTALPLSRVSGRVSRGATLAAFETLHPDGLAVKPVSWVVGEEGLSMLLGAGTVEERLLRLGFEKRWIERRRAAGEAFRLALFPAEAAEPATWDGIFNVVRETFPEAAPKVLARAGELRALPFAELQARATAGYLRGASYFEVNEAAMAGASEDSRYLSTARLASEQCEGRVEEVRGWLYHVLGLSDLFDGAGSTVLPDGRRGVGEFLIRNRRVADFGEAFAWVELTP